LFGHEKGSFTGADTRKIGLFEAADTGDIFLDEIAETTPAMQVKLLRVLQEGVFFRVGGQEPISVDVRVIAATNKDLKKMVERKEFREDLYYRLDVVRIHLPPLRDRKDDIPLLIDYFLRKSMDENGRRMKKMSAEAMTALTSFSWPGNVRQLENAVERAVIMSESNIIGKDDLPPELQRGASPLAPVSGLTLKDAQTLFKTNYIKQTLEECGQNQNKTAVVLDIQRTYLSRLIKELGIREERRAGL
jgi:Nif-specific regulatory protein